MPWPVIRIAPNPRRTTSSWPLIVNVPAARASVVMRRLLVGVGRLGWHRMQGVDTVRDRPSPVLILGVAALTIHLLVPLLPIHGNGFQFFWSGIPASFLVRWVTDYLVARWSGAIALLFGVWMLRRGHTSVAAGVFVAIAVVVVGGLLNQLIPLPSA